MEEIPSNILHPVAIEWNGCFD